MRRSLHQLIADGVVGGVLAGLVVALWFLAVDSLAGLLLADASRVAVVPWPHVVAANVLSGFVLMGYLHRAARDQHPFGLGALKGHPLLTQGLVTGLIGAGVVALWFFTLDLAAGH